MVGGVAALATLIALVTLVSRVACRSRAPAVDPDRLTMICPKCTHVFTVSRQDVGLDATSDMDTFRAKAIPTACPECGRSPCAVAGICRHCNRPYLPPRTDAELKDFQCPHCGRHPVRP